MLLLLMMMLLLSLLMLVLLLKVLSLLLQPELLLLVLLLLLFGYCLGKERYARPLVTIHSIVPWVLPRARPQLAGEISLILGTRDGRPIGPGDTCSPGILGAHAAATWRTRTPVG